MYIRKARGIFKSDKDKAKRKRQAKTAAKKKNDFEMHDKKALTAGPENKEYNDTKIATGIQTTPKLGTSGNYVV